MSQPLGTVTFMFTDVEGSTRLWESHPTEMGAALARHDEILRTTVAEHRGHVFTTAGDSFAVAFARAEDAVNAAVAGPAPAGRRTVARGDAGPGTDGVAHR